MGTSQKLWCAVACAVALGLPAVGHAANKGAKGPTYKAVTKQWAKAGRGEAFFTAPSHYIPLKGEALATYREYKSSGLSPKVVELSSKTEVAKGTFGIYTSLDRGSYLNVFKRQEQSTIANGHSNDVSPRVFFRKP